MFFFSRASKYSDESYYTGSFDEAIGSIEESTGVSICKRSVDEMQHRILTLSISSGKPASIIDRADSDGPIN